MRTSENRVAGVVDGHDLRGTLARRLGKPRGAAAGHDRLANGRVTKSVTIATDSSGRQRIPTDGLSQARDAAALAIRVCTWLRDEEAAG